MNNPDDVFSIAASILSAVDIEPTEENTVRLVHSFFKAGVSLGYPAWLFDHNFHIGRNSLKVKPSNNGKPRNEETQFWLDLTMAYRDFTGKRSNSAGGPCYRFVVAAMRELGYGSSYTPEPAKVYTSVYQILELRRAKDA